MWKSARKSKCLEDPTACCFLQVGEGAGGEDTDFDSVGAGELWTAFDNKDCTVLLLACSISACEMLVSFLNLAGWS